MNMSGMSMNNEETNTDQLSEYDLELLNRPWWVRDQPGRTGSFLGHALPATFFLGFSIFYLLLSLHRARNLPPGRSFAETHIPERDAKLMKKIFVSVSGASMFGILFEMYSGKHEGLFFHIGHESLYLNFLVFGLCGYFEFKGRLPADSHRAALTMAFLCSSLTWYFHGAMKKLEADRIVHYLLAYTNLLTAAFMAYSIKYKDSVIAFVGSFAGVVLQGIWLLTAGLYECCVDIPTHDVATYWAVETMLLVLVVALTIAFFGPEPSQQDNPQFRQGFSPLKHQEDDDVDDNSQEKC